MGEDEATKSNEEGCIEIGENYKRINSYQTTIAEEVKCQAPSLLTWHLVLLEDDEHKPWL